MKNNELSIEQFLAILPDNSEPSNKYLGWEKLNLSDFKTFNLIGKLTSEEVIEKTTNTPENYWSENYPFALKHFPNAGAEIYSDNQNIYLVYKDFGGHIPETRCRQVRKELITHE